MGYDLEKANETLRYFERLVEEGRVESWSGELKVFHPDQHPANDKMPMH